MTDRVVVLLLGPVQAPAAPPGCDGALFAAAMAEDVFAVFGELEGIDEAIAFSDPAGAALAGSLAWPGTALVQLAAGSALPDLWRQVTERGYRQAAIVVADAPDLPALHVAKAFSALGSSAAAAAPAVNGGVVILAGRLPPPPGVAGADMDRPPPPGVRRTLPWHRLRRPGDLARLDPGLEGWEATRALLPAGSSPGPT